MYYVIGVDGREYGPVSAEVLRQWIAEGRANQRTQARLEGDQSWKPLADLPEFAAALGPTVGPLPSAPDSREGARAQLTGPATALMVIALLHLVFGGLMLLGRSLRFSGPFIPSGRFPGEMWTVFMGGAAGLFSELFGLATSVIVLVGAIKMQRLENHSLAVVASILALLPFTSPCCVLGLPFGIWSLVVLYRPDVRAAFH